MENKFTLNYLLNVSKGQYEHILIDARELGISFCFNNNVPSDLLNECVLDFTIFHNMLIVLM